MKKYTVAVGYTVLDDHNRTKRVNAQLSVWEAELRGQRLQEGSEITVLYNRLSPSTAVFYPYGWATVCTAEK